jgi:hypothetical protein
VRCELTAEQALALADALRDAADMLVAEIRGAE